MQSLQPQQLHSCRNRSSSMREPQQLHAPTAVLACPHALSRERADLCCGGGSGTPVTSARQSSTRCAQSTPPIPQPSMRRGAISSDLAWRRRSGLPSAMCSGRLRRETPRLGGRQQTGSRRRTGVWCGPCWRGRCVGWRTRWVPSGWGMPPRRGG